jgi:hypothetical protein
VVPKTFTVQYKTSIKEKKNLISLSLTICLNLGNGQINTYSLKTTLKRFLKISLATFYNLGNSMVPNINSKIKINFL